MLDVDPFNAVLSVDWEGSGGKNLSAAITIDELKALSKMLAAAVLFVARDQADGGEKEQAHESLP